MNFAKLSENGSSIFNALLEQETAAARKHHPQLSRLAVETEETFFFLVEKVEAKIGEEKLNCLLEKPDHSGETLFHAVSYLQENLASWILDRNIEVNFIDSKWLTPQFAFPNLVEKMLRKGVNPFIMAYNGKSLYENYFTNFENIDDELLNRFLIGQKSDKRTAASYSFVDSNCGDKCRADCDDKMERFKLKNGQRKLKTKKYGGQGSVGFGKWHGQKMAFKKLKLEKIDGVEYTHQVLSNAEITRAEFEMTKGLSHKNIVKVVHLYRYQETQEVEGERMTNNWTVIVMERYEKNIGELSACERFELPKLLEDSLGSGCANAKLLLPHAPSFLRVFCAPKSVKKWKLTDFNPKIFDVFISLIFSLMLFQTINPCPICPAEVFNIKICCIFIVKIIHI